MNHYERLAITTAIEAIEGQLKGIKTLLAAASTQTSATTAHKVVPAPVPQDPFSYEASPEDEAFLEQQAAIAQKALDEQRIAIAKAAADAHSDIWAEEARARGLATKTVDQMIAENAAAAAEGVPV